MQIKDLCNCSLLSAHDQWKSWHLLRFSTKTLLIMKMLFILLTGAFLNVSATGTSQTITLTGKDISLSTIFSQIEKQTGFVVVSKYELLQKAKPVSVDAKNQPLDDFLQTILKDQPFDYFIENKTISIKEKPVLSAADLQSTTGNLPPPVDIHGRIVNENGQPLAGASVGVKGTNRVVASDDRGYYKIENISTGEYALEVSYVGYKNETKSIKVTANASTSVLVNFELALNPYGFNDIIISANLVASKKREIASAVTTITAADIEKLPITNITDLFRGEVPGANSWKNPGIVGSGVKLRGDIDFQSGQSTVKVFIDGIEAASSSLLANLPLSSIDHIEVLRGPQASTLYGSGATSGVVFIFTKKGKVGGPHINAKISAGTIASRYVAKKVYQQDHSLDLSGGSEEISYNLGGAYLHVDPYWEGANNTNVSSYGGIKIKQSNLTAELNGQYVNTKTGQALNPINKNLFPTVPDFTTPYKGNLNKYEQQTLGMNMGYAPFSWWQHNASVGIDQINFSNNSNPRNIADYDTLTAKVRSSLTKKSYRYYTTLKTASNKFIKATITAGIDHYLFESVYSSYLGIGMDPDFSPIPQYSSSSIGKYSNTGFYGQGVFGFDNKFFLTTGIRSESTKSFNKNSGSSVAPKVGASYVLDLGNAMLKPRASYGKSIKVPDPSQFVEITTSYPQYGVTNHQLANPNLKPQEQTGFDVGMDVEFGKGLGTFEATYYNQRVKNFITIIIDYSNYPPLVEYQYINVGKINNKGIELAGTLNFKALKFRFTYALTSSKVADIANTGYESNYQNGDVIWGIPKSNGSATITYSFPSLSKSSSPNGGSISFGATYFGEWENQDLIAQYRDYYINNDYSKTPRDYVIKYPGYALFRMTANYSLNKNLELFLNISNLFNVEKFENTNTVPTQGRITMLGVRVNI